MDDKKQKVNELVPMNDTLYDEYYVNELEERLETDPCFNQTNSHQFGIRD